MTRVPIAADEWMVLFPPGCGLGTAGLQRAARELASRCRLAGVPQANLISRLPDGSIDPRLGTAVLHVASGHAAIYCPAGQVTATAAARVSALAGHAAIIPPAGRASGTGGVTITRIRHASLPAVLHPAVALARPRRPGGRIVICDRIITAAAADGIGQLCTALAMCAEDYLSLGRQLTAGTTGLGR